MELINSSGTKVKVINPLANKNVLQYIEGKDHYSIMVPKDKLEESSTYKKLKDKYYKETNESLIIYNLRLIMDLSMIKCMSLVKILRMSFNYIKTCFIQRNCSKISLIRAQSIKGKKI